MQTVLLIGDSIRMGYQPFVAEALNGRLNITGPLENCETSRKCLKFADDWLSAANSDVVHVNCGLHDIRIDPGAPSNQVGIDEYRDNVKQLLITLARRVPRIIWATMTPVNDEWHTRNKDSRRTTEDVKAYNATACSVAVSLGVEINDLCRFVETRNPLGLWEADGLHFNETGYRLLGGAVAARLLSGA
jgi:isoamyl acetate esterase